MLRSLVGSEMCIRDRQLGYALTQGGNINFAVSECLAQRANSWHCVKVADVCAKVASFRYAHCFPLSKRSSTPCWSVEILYGWCKPVFFTSNVGCVCTGIERRNTTFAFLEAAIKAQIRGRLWNRCMISRCESECEAEACGTSEPCVGLFEFNLLCTTG